MHQGPGVGGLGRFAEPAVLVMVSLGEAPKITIDIEQLAIRLGPGTLYGAIARLEERGLIEPISHAHEVDLTLPSGLAPTLTAKA